MYATLFRSNGDGQKKQTHLYNSESHNFNSHILFNINEQFSYLILLTLLSSVTSSYRLVAAHRLLVMHVDQ